MIQYWYRVTNLPDENLAKKALLENISLKTNWIMTIENLLNIFKLSDPTQYAKKLKYIAKSSIHDVFVEYWKNNISTNKGRLEFYSNCKYAFKLEEYLCIPSFEKRKAIAKLRCSDHALEIEKGRHKKIPREARLCKLCTRGNIETEEHFLFECTFYDDIRTKVNFDCANESIFAFDNSHKLGEYIMLALTKRGEKLESW